MLHGFVQSASDWSYASDLGALRTEQSPQSVQESKCKSIPKAQPMKLAARASTKGLLPRPIVQLDDDDQSQEVPSLVYWLIKSPDPAGEAGWHQLICPRRPQSDLHSWTTPWIV